MTLLNVAILAIVQGLTEFLPVSSSGHLLLVRLLFNVSDVNGSIFDAFLHLGTLGAVLIYFRHIWWHIIRSLFKLKGETDDSRGLLWNLVLATIPAALVGYFLENIVATTFRTPYTLAFSFGFTALILWFSDTSGGLPDQEKSNYSKPRFEKISNSSALFIGLWQIVALIPGISRSGITIAAGRWQKLSRVQATTFSFLLSAPIIAGAGLHSLPAVISTPDYVASQLVIGFFLALISGLIAMHILLKLIERISFRPFAVYLTILAIVTIFYA